MKSEISSLELNYLVRELSILENSKIDRIYHLKENHAEFMIAFHVSGKGKYFLKIILPGIIYLSNEKTAQGTPTGLCMMLRKYLEGAILKKIYQKNFERVLVLECEIKTKKYTLIIELFSKGNIIFCDSEYKILNLLDEENWKDRILKKDETYIFPKSKNKVLNIDEREFSEILKKSDRESIVKALAIELSLGGVYAEYICEDSKIDKNTKIEKIKEYKNLYSIFKKLFEEELHPNLTSKGVFPFEIDSEEPEQYYETYSEAIEHNHNNVNEKKAKNVEKQIEKIQSIITEQEKNLEDCKKQSEDNQEKAESLYREYQLINEILKTIKDARKKYSWKEIKEKIKADKKYAKIITEINEKKNEITIRLESHNE